MKSIIIPIVTLIGIVAIITVNYNAFVQKDYELDQANKKISELEHNFKLYMNLWFANGYNKTGKRAGLYNNGVICVYIANQSWSRVMETCSHELLHWKYDNHFN